MYASEYKNKIPSIYDIHRYIFVVCDFVLYLNGGMKDATFTLILACFVLIIPRYFEVECTQQEKADSWKQLNSTVVRNTATAEGRISIKCQFFIWSRICVSALCVFKLGGFNR